MGIERAFSSHRRWSDAETAFVAANYSTALLSDLLAGLPGRTFRTIQCKANGMGLQRRKPGRTPDQVREAKRAHMARRRQSDPQAAREYSRKHRQRNREAINARTRAETARRLFWARALRLRNGVTASALASLWRQQRGRCALTGRRLDRTAEVDHKTPRARGGGDELTNLQWVCPAANRAKRDLTDTEFLALCQDAARWIGQRIANQLEFV